MTEPLAEQVERLRHRLDAIRRNQRDAEERFARLDSMRAEVAAIAASVTSKDRAVTVTAGPGGAVRSVRFAEEARRLTPNQLSHSVTTTIQQAVAEAARQQAAVVQDYVGDQIDVVGRVMRSQEELLGHALRPAEPAPAGGAPAQRPGPGPQSAPAPPQAPQPPRWAGAAAPPGERGWGIGTPPEQRPRHAAPPPAGPAAAPPVPPAAAARQAPRRSAGSGDDEDFSVFDRGARSARREPAPPPSPAHNSDGVMRLYDGESG
jgi:hypothetical protein